MKNSQPLKLPFGKGLSAFAPPKSRGLRGPAILASIAVLLALPVKAQNTVTNGLVAYWNFDGNLFDSIKDFDGTARGTPAIPFVEGKAGFGQAIQLDGGNQFVEITGGSENDLEFPGGSMSIAGWFKVDNFDTDWQALIAKGEGSNYRIARRANGNSIAYAGGIGEGADDAPDINDGLWHHFVAISDSAATEFGTALYVDGVQYSVNSTAPVLTANAARLMIGENPEARGREWEGEIDDIAIWNRVLTAAEIAALYAEGAGRAISTLLPPPTTGTAAFVRQPASVSVVEGGTAEFTAEATATGDFPPTYQWQKNGTDIPGATGTSYKTPVVTLADSGTKYTVKATVGQSVVTSAEATLTVLPDTIPPTLVGATAFPNTTKIGLMFNEDLDVASAAVAANYMVNGAAITSAVVRTNVANELTNEKHLVQLTVPAALTSDFTVTVTGVKDAKGNAITTAQTAGKILKLTSTDIGSPESEPGGPDPQAPSVITTWGPGAFDVLTTGSNDYWNNADGFNFLWEPKTNSFDVKVRVVSVSPINNWSAGAIEVREGPPTANGQGWELARHYFAKVDYGGPDAIPVLDGSGDGADSYEFNARLAPGDPTLRETSNNAPGGSVGWGGAGPGNPSPVPFPNAWIRIARVKDGASDHLLGYSSSDGIEWDLRQDVDLNDEAHAGFLDLNGNPAGPMPDVLYVGLGSTSHTGIGNNNAVNEGNVGEFWYSPIGQPYSCFVIYRDYGDFASAAPPSGISITHNPDGSLTLTYTGTLSSADIVTGPFTPVAGASSPFNITPRTSGKQATFYVAR
jgi:hypothetical protein